MKTNAHILCAAAAACFLTVNPSTADEKNPATEKRYAVITLSANFQREAPDYTAELGNQLLMGTPVEITGSSGYWLKVVGPDNYPAWCTDLGLAEMDEAGLEEYIAARKAICTARYGRMLESPSGKATAVRDVVKGDIMIDCGKSRNGFRKVGLASGETGWIRRSDIEDFGEWAASRRPTPDNIVAEAMEYLGTPYMWGGTSTKGVDCSGLTRMVWYMNGVLLPRNASQQALAGTPVALDPEAGMHERTAGLEKGDLIFFGTPGENGGKDRITHVGIYLGNGRFIHSSHYVRINSLYPEDNDCYENCRKLIRARRISGSGTEAGTVKISDSSAYFIR